MLRMLAAMLTSGNATPVLHLFILLPFVLGLLVVLFNKTNVHVKTAVLLLGSALNFVFALGLYVADDVTLLIPWAGFGINFALRVYGFSRLFVLIAASIQLLLALYSASYLKNKEYKAEFIFFFLLAIALTNGVLLANNLVVLLFFCECLVLVVFGIMAFQNEGKDIAFKTAALNCIADLLLMLGIAICYSQAGTLMMDGISGLSLEGVGGVGFVCLSLGAVGKMTAFPFGSWVADAAHQCPLPFIALVPAVLNKLTGTYLFLRISLDFYVLQSSSLMGSILMWIGAITLLFSSVLLIVQHDMKKMIAYASVGQAGLIILGLGSELPVGIIGGLFHMLNQFVYLTMLFMAAGAVELSTGTTDLRHLGGLGRLMPITGICFIFGALALVGIPCLCGFFSSQLVFEAIWSSGKWLLIITMFGLFCTAGGFLKCAHAVFFGATCLPDGIHRKDVREAPAAMLLPMLILLVLCILLGVLNKLPLQVLQPLLNDTLLGVDYSGWPHFSPVMILTLACVLLAVGNHAIGCRVTGSAVKADDHIYYAPVLHQLYKAAEQHYLDPYNIMMAILKLLSILVYSIDRIINWIYDVLFVKLFEFSSESINMQNSSSIRQSMLWILLGLSFLCVLFLVVI